MRREENLSNIHKQTEADQGKVEDSWLRQWVPHMYGKEDCRIKTVIRKA